MENINWDIFHCEENKFYPYTIEDVGIGYTLIKFYNIEPIHIDPHCLSSNNLKNFICFHYHNYRT